MPQRVSVVQRPRSGSNCLQFLRNITQINPSIRPCHVYFWVAIGTHVNHFQEQTCPDKFSRCLTSENVTSASWLLLEINFSSHPVLASHMPSGVERGVGADGQRPQVSTVSLYQRRAPCWEISFEIYLWVGRWGATIDHWHGWEKKAFTMNCENKQDNVETNMEV